ncbi:thiol-disulfide oxidoreductase DCC family protein [Roseovarius sp. S4756]|uniref:thiol-disulfide oxidoreductase DCC family protein n=1 Tax=Roseovarius maritimus TaxID=3342637 RepID=UPI00372A2E7D
MSAAGADEQGALTVYYDGACPLCRAELSHYTARDKAGRLALVDVSQPEVRLPDELDAKDAKARFHVRTPDGRLVSGAAGFAQVWGRVPGWGWAARLASVPGVLPVLELGYRGFLKLRPRIVGMFIRLQHLRGRG